MTSFTNLRPENPFPMANILMIADSRGKHLDKFFVGLTPHRVYVATHPGAGVLSSVHHSHSILQSRTWNQIYLLAGLCDLSTKDKTTKRVAIRENDISVLTTIYRDNLVSAVSFIRETFPHLKMAKCIAAPVTGMDIDRYNLEMGLPSEPLTQQQQLLFDQLVILVNNEIAYYNHVNGSFTPWTSRLIHHRNSKRNSYQTRYFKLAVDGCHLTDEVRTFWANALVEAIVKNE